MYPRVAWLWAPEPYPHTRCIWTRRCTCSCTHIECKHKAHTKSQRTNWKRRPTSWRSSVFICTKMAQEQTHWILFSLDVMATRQNAKFKLQNVARLLCHVLLETMPRNGGTWSRNASRTKKTSHRSGPVSERIVAEIDAWMGDNLEWWLRAGIWLNFHR